MQGIFVDLIVNYGLVFTSAPGIQVYTANWLNVPKAKGGVSYAQYQGVCLETQHFPNTPNWSHFPHCLLHPNEEYVHVVKHRFSW